MLAAGLLPLAPLPASAAAPGTPAGYSRAAMTRTELAIVPEALGKVTKAGKVAGTIDAFVGDIVLPASTAAPNGYAGPAPTVAGRQRAAGSTAAATTAATVLHADRLRVTDVSPGPSGLRADIRTLIAMEENTSREARGYFRARLVYGTTTDYTWDTYHEADAFRVHRGDEDNSEADNCLDMFAPYEHCTWTKDPSGCRGPNPPCGAYQVVGTYRPKGNDPDLWLTEVQRYRFWHPVRNEWVTYASCETGDWLNGYLWQIGGNDVFSPQFCPWPVGSG
jgi:hypothetical protein